MRNRDHEALNRVQVEMIGLNYAPEPTGSAPYTAGLAEMIAEFAGVEALVGVPHYPAWRVDVAYRLKLRKREARNGVDVHHFRHFVPKRQSAIGRALWDATFVLNGALYRPQARPDVVIASTPSLGGAVLGAFYARRYRAPLGVVVQDLVGQAAGQSGISGGAGVARLVAKVERWSLRRADVIAIVSEKFRGQLREYGVDDAKIRVFPNWTHIAASTATRAETRARYGWDDGTFVVLHSGNMGLKQGLGNVIDAARLLAGHDEIRVVFCGDGNQRARLQAQADGLGNVTFLDPVPDADYADLLSAADLLLVNERASVGDMALPSKLTSYFASGRPVLAAVSPDGACAHEIAKADGAGLAVPPEQPAVLAKAITDLAADPKRAAGYGEAGRQYAKSHLGRVAASVRARQFIDDLTRDQAFR